MIWRAGTALFRRLQRRRWPGLNRRVVLFLCHSLLFHIALLGIADVLLNFYLVSVGYDAATIGLREPPDTAWHVLPMAFLKSPVVLALLKDEHHG